MQIGAYKNRDCFKWRENSIKRMQQIKPAAIILSGFQYFDVPDSFPSRQSWWTDGQKLAYQNLRGASSKLIYISDTPHPNRDIPNCLAADGKSKCDDSEKSDPRISGGFIQVNPTPWLCTNKCPAVVNGIVAYRDASLSFLGECEKTVTSAPIAAANLTPMCPRPPNPITATFLPGPAFQCLIGE